jgi:hypothetical protein
MQYLLHCVVYFKVQSTTREVFMVDVVDVVLANRKVFTQQHTQDVEVALVWYKKANGIASSFNNDTN